MVVNDLIYFIRVIAPLNVKSFFFLLSGGYRFVAQQRLVYLLIYFISRIFTDYYKSLLETPQNSTTTIPISQLGHSPLNLTDLANTFSEEEITKTVQSLAKSKSVGPDGFPAEFCQKYWPIVKGDVIKLAHAFYNNELDLWRLNRAAITLIL
jgi:hypothetical protein